MPETHISIGRVKRDISDLVNRVFYGGERIVLTSRGKPKAALVSIQDYERLEQDLAFQGQGAWQAWEEDAQALAVEILGRRGGRPLDTGVLWQQARADLEARDDRNRGG